MGDQRYDHWGPILAALKRCGGEVSAASEGELRTRLGLQRKVDARAFKATLRGLHSAHKIRCIRSQGQIVVTVL